jgi:hypothetical protein
MIPTLGEQGFILLHSVTQWGSTSALQTEVEIGEAAAESCRRSTSLVTSAARQVTIGCVLRGW